MKCAAYVCLCCDQLKPFYYDAKDPKAEEKMIAHLGGSKEGHGVEADDVTFREHYCLKKNIDIPEQFRYKTEMAKGGGKKEDKGWGKAEAWKSGDWECPKCGCHVFAAKDNCFKRATNKRTMRGAEGQGGGSYKKWKGDEQDIEELFEKVGEEAVLQRAPSRGMLNEVAARIGYCEGQLGS